MKKKVFEKQYPVYSGQTDTIAFLCSKCDSKISKVITFPAPNGGDKEEITCLKCNAKHEANIFSHEVGGYIDVYEK